MSVMSHQPIDAISHQPPPIRELKAEGEIRPTCRH
jgi:hypothetical protein